jgi:hypothetical protein
MADKDGMRGEEEAPAVAEDAAAAHEEIPEESFIPAELVGNYTWILLRPLAFPMPMLRGCVIGPEIHDGTCTSIELLWVDGSVAAMCLVCWSCPSVFHSMLACGACPAAINSHSFPLLFLCVARHDPRHLERVLSAKIRQVLMLTAFVSCSEQTQMMEQRRQSRARGGSTRSSAALHLLDSG